MINNSKEISSDQVHILFAQHTQETRISQSGAAQHSVVQNQYDAKQYIDQLRLNRNIDSLVCANFEKILLESTIPSSWKEYSIQIKNSLRETSAIVIQRILDSLDNDLISINVRIYGSWVSVGDLFIAEEIKQKLIVLLDRYVDEDSSDIDGTIVSVLSGLFTQLNQDQLNRLVQTINDISISTPTEIFEKHLTDILLDFEPLRRNQHLCIFQKLSLQKVFQEYIATRADIPSLDYEKIDQVLMMGLRSIAPINWRSCSSAISNLIPSDTFQKLIQPLLRVHCKCENIEQAEALFTYADILCETYGCLYGSLLLRSLLPHAPQELNQVYTSIRVSHDSKITLKNAISQSLTRNHQALNNKTLHSNGWNTTFREMQISQLLKLLNDKSESIESGPITIFHEEIIPGTITSDELSAIFKTLYTSEYESTSLDELVNELLNGLSHFPSKNRKEVILSVHGSLCDRDRVHFLESLTPLYPGIENYFIVDTNTWSRITTNEGVKDILKFSPKFSKENKIGVRTLFELQGINWQDQIDKGQSLFITQISNHFVTLCALNKELTGRENSFLLLDSMADGYYIEKIRTQLAPDALILTNVPPIDTPKRSVYERQKDFSNCSFFALMDAKILLKNPELVETMWKNKTPTSDANRLLISIEKMPWQFYLPTQSVKNIKKFSGNLPDNEKKTFLKKIEKHLFWSQINEKYLNRRIDYFARKQEKTLLNLALGEE